MPEISLGLWHNFGDVETLSNSRKKLHFAFDNGITHIDLANNYGPSYGSAEDELFISTKAGHDMWPGPYGEWGSRKTDDPETPLEETLQALVDIAGMGKAL